MLQIDDYETDRQELDICSFPQMRYSCLRVHKKTVDFDFFQITGSKKCDAKQDKEDVCSFPQINEIFARISCSVTLTFV